MSKTAVRAVNRQIRRFRSERLRVLAGRDVHWGVPWCHGAGSPGHQEPLCEGCATAALASDEAAGIAERIRLLQESLAPAVQGGLW